MSGLLLHSAADVVARAFVALGLGGDPEVKDSTGLPTAAWPCYDGTEPDFPDNVIAVKDGAGRQQGSSMITGIVARNFGLQVMVRGRTKTLSVVRMHLIRHSMENTDPAAGVVVYGMNVIIGATTYKIHCFSDIGDVLPVGFEQGSNRFVHTINVMATIRKL